MFHNRVERIPIDDHNVPRLRLESDLSPVVTLSLSPQWCVMCDGKEESVGEISPSLSSFPSHVTRHQGERERERERERDDCGQESLALFSLLNTPAPAVHVVQEDQDQNIIITAMFYAVFTSNFKVTLNSKQTDCKLQQLLNNISTCPNCSSVGCLKCVQFHNWFWLH